MRNKLGRLIKSVPIVAAFAAGDMLTLTHTSLVGLAGILWLVLAIPILGSLVLSIFLNNKKFSFGEWLIYSIGVAIAIIMAFGLVINTFGLVLHLAVLRTSVVLPLFNALAAIVLLVRSIVQRQQNLFPVFFPNRHLLTKLRLLLPLILPLIAVVGAISLNNGGTSNIAILALTLVVLYPLVLVFFAKKAYEQEFIVSIFAISLALLLSVSMRSNHLIGFDIHQEYQVFTAAVRSGVWNPHAFSGVYNACLSITILPSIFSALMPISTEYVFKFAMQMLFAAMPVIVYVIASRRFKKKYLAYIAALLFVAQGQFIFEFPALIRQEVAFIFFGLIFASASSAVLTKFAKSTLLVIFGLAMVVSHYSTTYVGIGVLILLVALRPLFRVARDHLQPINSINSKTPLDSLYLSPVIVIIILLTTFLWYGETLQTSGGIVQKVVSSVTSFSSIFSSDSHSDFVNTTFGLGGFTYNTQTLEHVSQSNAVADGYQPSAAQYQPTPAFPAGPAITNSLEGLIYSLEHRAIPLFAGGMVGVGVICMFFGALFKRKKLEDGLLAFAGGFLFLVLALLPNLSQDYNLERLYQQLLIVLSPAFIYGFFFIFKRWLPSTAIAWIIVAVVVGYLGGSSGLIDQVIFGASNINTVNTGTNYDHYYVQDGEVDALTWLQSNYDGQDINFDRYSLLSGEAYSTLPSSKIKQGLLPTEIKRSSYVYVSSANLKQDLTFDEAGGQVITFNFPGQYLDNNKNIIYSNGDSEVLK